MPFTRQTVTIQRNTPQIGAAGGKVDNWAVVGTAEGERHQYSAQRYTNMVAADVQTFRAALFWEFRPAFPDIRHMDMLVEDGGDRWLVLNVREYGWTMQVDCEKLD